MEEVGKLLPAIFKRQAQRPNPLLAEFLAPLWPRIAGKPIAKQSRPVTFEQGTLTLVASCPAWSAELRRLAAELRATINSYIGAPVVKKLRVECRPQTENPRIGAEQSKPGIAQVVSTGLAAGKIRPLDFGRLPRIPPKRAVKPEGSPTEDVARVASAVPGSRRGFHPARRAAKPKAAS